MNKRLSFTLFIIIFLNLCYYSFAQTTITHNCGPIIKTTNHSCSSGDIYWAKDYILSQFGITNQDEFIISKGQVALSYTTWQPNVQFNIYEIDNNFPNSFSTANLIGSSQVQQLPIIGWNQGVQVITVDFDTAIVIPQNVERILVEVKKGVEYGDALAHIAGTTQDNGISWYRNCLAGPEYINADQITNSQWPGSNYNFYINIIGLINNTISPFTINYTNDCSETNKEFHLSNTNNISFVNWNFGDPASGVNNSSNLISPLHNFTSSGQYTIIATILQTDGTTYTLNQTILVAEPPTAFPVDDIYACENSLGSGFSSNFDTSDIESEVVNGQTGVTVSYYDQNGNALPSPLPNPFTNTQSNSQEITIRVSNSSDLCCYTESSFNLITVSLPQIIPINDIHACDSDGDGHSVFDLSNIPINLVNGQTNLNVELFDSNDNLIPVSDYNNFTNLTASQDYIKAIATDTTSNCSSEININLLVNDNPVANQLPTIYGCDDNNDGISEYFDTSNVESQVLNGQTGMSVSYFDQSGNELPSPLPNPYINSVTFNELITVRVTDNSSTCYAETGLQLQTVTQPNINQPDNLYACDQGNGYAVFDTSSTEQQLIGSQTGLTIQYYDNNNNPLPSPLPELFQNTEPFSQTIIVRIEDVSNPICYSETSFDLIINELPEINLEDEYFICNLEPSISLNINSGFNSYNWFFENGTLISATNSAEIANEGNYTLTITKIENDITCENSFEFTLIRSVLPEIQQVNFGELGNNYIKIIASGDGHFEYSIDGINYQDSNYFSNIQGGMYTVFVRDKDGCGQDSEEVTVIDYPKFFTPNNDGYNDFWQIKGIANFPNSKTSIFDRYGKLLTAISSNEIGWNGLYNGKLMMSNDYWFRTDLGNGRTFSGHFSLKR